MSNQSPFSILAGLAERSRQVATELPPIENTQRLWNGLGFILLGNQFVAPMSEVGELMRVPQATRLPGVKPFVLGIANVRGRLMAILDLARFFGGKTSHSRSLRRVLTVEEDEQYFGFVIDESLGMQHFPQEAFEKDIEVDSMFQPFVKGGFRVATSEWPILSLTALAADPDLEKLAR